MKSAWILRAGTALSPLLLACLPLPGLAQKSGTEPEVRVIRLAPCPSRSGERDLEYPLLPDPLSVTPGNAAPLWVRAGLVAQEQRRAFPKGEHDWYYNPKGKVEFSAAKAKKLLEKLAGALRLADQAARMDRCDWGRPPLTFQNLQDNLPLTEVQLCREIARLLDLRCQLELSEKDFASASYTLQTGLMLGKHVGSADTLIESLVGAAITSVMLHRVEQWLQTEDSPNLYWSLTVLPDPLIDVRHSILYELDTMYRSFPQLKELKKGGLSTGEVNRLVDKVLQSVGHALGGEGMPTWARTLGPAGLTLRYHGQAKDYLIKQGMSKERVEKMPATQVVFVAFLHQHDRTSDEIRKWTALPYWQGHAKIEKVTRDASVAIEKRGNPLLGLLMPALAATYKVQPRLARQVAALRGAEALRLYAASHKGKPPARWSDLEVPLPLDPYTGKGLDAFYKMKEGRGVLTIDLYPERMMAPDRRYELGPKP
jgi:hypothetical protein